MLITAKNLLHLLVFTKSQDYLGKIVDFEVEVDSQLIIKYYVKGSGLMKFLGGSKLELIISHTQVISITAERMIVEDNVIREKEEEKESRLELKKPEIVLPSRLN